MSCGKLLVEDTPLELKQKYSSGYTLDISNKLITETQYEILKCSLDDIIKNGQLMRKSENEIRVTVIPLSH